MNKNTIHPLSINLESAGQEIIKVAVSGGPCGGKTTILAKAIQKMQDMGVAMIVVPELATEYLTHGILCGKNIDPDRFQEAIFLGTMEREYRYVEIAKMLNCPRVVVVSDRGCMDGMAYTSREKFEYMVGLHGYNLSQVSEGLYKGIIHLRSLACEFPEMYSCANNEARKESPDQAKWLDAKTEAVWLNHPHLRIIGNEDHDGKLIDLDRKARVFVTELTRIIGIPEPLEIERRFVLRGIPKIPVKYEMVDIVQYYLKTPDGEERIRIRTWNGKSTYYRTQKVYLGPGIRSEKESIITAVKFGELIRFADPDRRPVTKTRYSFVYNNQYFELDVFTGHFTGLVMLEIELTDRNQEVSVPPFVGGYSEVTDNPKYSNAALAAADTMYWLE